MTLSPADKKEPTQIQQAPLERSHHLVTLSAKSKNALQRLAKRYSTALAETSDSLANIGFTTLTRRSHFKHRLAIVAESIEDLRQQLGEFALSSDHHRFLYRELPIQAEANPIAFLFTGQGSQYTGMGKVLYETQPTFRRILNQCDELLRDYLELPLLSVLYPKNADSPHLHQTAYTQPALFALEYALAHLWQSYGIVPDAVMGHSVGEYTAACVAGVFSLEDGLRLIAERARLMQSLPKNGMMVAVFASEAQIAPLIEPYQEQVAIATINGVSNVVISGRKDKVQDVLDLLRGQGIQFRQLQVSHAFHSPLMAPILDSFEAFANTLSFQAPNCSLLSNLTGQFWKPGEVPDATYWSLHLRETVRFSDGMEKLAQEGYRLFMEIGPNSTLLSMGQRCLSEPSSLWLPSLKRGQPDWIPFLNSLGQLYLQDVDIDWLKFDQDYQRRPVRLPNYPFEHQRYWESVEVPVPKSKSNPSPQPPQPSEPNLPPVIQFQHPWFYQWQWQPEPLSAPQDLSSGAILVLGESKTWGEDLAKHISQNSHPLYWAIPGQSFSRSADQFTLNPANPQDYEQLIKAIQSESDQQPIVAVIHLWNGLHPENDLDISDRILAENDYSVLFVGQALLKHCPKQSIAFLQLTLGNYAVTLHHPIQGIHQIIGATLTQVLAQENPSFKTKVVDLMPKILKSGQLGHILWQELRTPPTGEGIIAIRGEQRLGRILVPMPAVPKQPIEEVIRDGDTYLITGGTSAVASEIAMGLVRQASLNLVLIGRQSLPPKEQWTQLLANHHPQCDRIGIIQQLEELGATVLYEAVDVTDANAMAQLMDKVRDRFGHLDGVIHAAGVQDQKNFKFHQKSWQTVAPVFAPKLQGTVILDTITRSEPLKFFVMISSAAASKAEWGTNLSDYAAANAFLDHYALYRSQQPASGRSLAINFALWRDRGMAKIGGQALVMVARAKGMNLLEPEAAVNSFIDTLTSSTPAVTHIIDFVRSSSQTTALSSSSSTTDVSPSSLPKAQVTHLEDLVKEILCEHIKLSVEQIEGYQSFSELGLDSLAGIEVIQQLNQSLNTQLSPTILFEYQSLDALVKYFEDNQKVFTSPLTVSATTSTQTGQISQNPEKNLVTDIAIIGMACKVPGANNLEEYWNLLSQGRSAIGSVPSSRWSTKDYFEPTKQTPYKTYCKWGGFIDNPYDFDPLFFGISPKEAMAIDPQQRLVLQLVWQALFQAGYGSKNRTQDISVFVGCGQNNYVEHFINYQSYGALCQRLETSEWFNQLPEQNRQALQNTLIEILQPSEILSETAAGNELNQLAARISHCLDLTGPSLSVSTACSSSLVALHLACDSLRSGQSSMAIVGGVNLNLSPTPLTFLSRVQALSETGTCYPFDSRANGMVIGEGAGVILLKPLQQAIADGDYIHGVIKGSAINNDGHSQGITAPNPQGQAKAIRQAYQQSGIAPETINYIETHGTGTLLGDPIEIEGMTQAFRTFTECQQFCGIGSVKSSIGHGLSASGILSLIKVVLSMQHQHIPGTQGYQSPNPNIDFAKTPFYVVGEQGMSWSNQEHPLRAGVNGFGFGGTNAHIILQQAPILSSSPRITDDTPSYLLCLTARTPAKLQQIASQLREHLLAYPEQEIAEVCFTMNQAQKEFPSKAAFVVKERQQLLDYLEAITNDCQPSEIYRGRANPKRSTPLSLILDGTNHLSVEDVTTIGQQFPVYKSAYEACQSRWKPFINYPQSSTKIHDFASQYAYLSWLKFLDVEPKKLLVAGIGILVGACFTGLLTLEEALAALARLEGEKIVIPAKKIQTEEEKSLNWHCPLVTPKGIFHPTTQVSSLQLSAFVQLGGSLNLAQETKQSETIYLYLGNSSDLVDRLSLDKLSVIWQVPSPEINTIEALLRVMARFYVNGVGFRPSELFAFGTRRVPLFIYPFDNKPYQAPVVESVNSDHTNQGQTEPIQSISIPSSSKELRPTDTVPILSADQRQQSYLALAKAFDIK
ncbi:SDR family oxidoreductase [Coleofasciculus chthonoplastes]|uniref:SDR family oxidoreductase n=1 Tax=Coleofasciculus chthonoplastes TaxID=64178 RepID=UPI003300D4AE